MPKKNVKEIREYYQKKNVAGSYDDRRFAGKGGGYINASEVNAAVHFIQNNDNTDVTVLDVGSGRGRLSIPLHQLGFDVFCLDSSKEMSKLLKGHIPNSHIMIQSAFDSYGFRNKFDYITSLRFFDHFDIKDQKKLLQIMTGKLKKNGQIVYLALNSTSIESAISTFFPYGRYNYYYNDEQYKKLFKSCGLKVVRGGGVFFLPRGVFLYLQKIPVIIDIAIVCDRLVSRLFPGVGALRTFVLEKI